MMKTAVFVEGQTELIFVRELLLKVFQYENIALECYNLFTEANFHPTEYAYPNDEAEYYFQIINVGNDKSVLTRLLNREKYLKNAGFKRIIGLRDMYSRDYRELAKNHQIDKAINEKFIAGHRAQIKSEDVFFSFAIMEAEAWLLGLRRSFERMDSRLTVGYIKKSLGIDLEHVDPEDSFFHPAENMNAIFELAGQRYNKSKGDINTLVSYIERNDFLDLFGGSKCQSFKEFYGYLQLPVE